MSIMRFFGKIEELAESRLRRVKEAAKQFYSQAEIDQAASNRRSKHDDQALINDFMSFEQPYHPIPRDNHFNHAIEVTTKLFKPDRILYPIAFPDLRYYPWNLSVNAEAPWNLGTWSFKPTFRDVDGESESPKLMERLSRLSNYISDKTVTVDQYLRAKAQLFKIDGRKTFHNLYNEIFNYNRSLVHFIKDGLHPFWKDGTPVPYFWNTLHARSHVVAADEPDKIRAVFGATKLLLMIENMFIWALQACYLNNDEIGRMFWGRETIRGGWRRLFSEVQKGGTPNTYLSLDWSQFDKRLLFELMTEVHRIWRSYFDFSRYQPTSFYPNAKTNPIRIERLWKWMCYCILHTPILLPDGRLFKWNYNGFGSGYQQTQLMDSFANMIMILTCLSALGVKIDSPHFWIRVQGDDSLVAFYEYMFRLYGPLFLTRLEETATFYFNAKLSSKKSQISDRLTEMSVLSYFNSYGLPYRTDEDLLRHLMFPEKVGPKDELLAAAIGLAYSACGCSPRFHALCEYLVNKYREQGVIPNRRGLIWMIKVGIFTESEIDQMLVSPIPSRLELRARAWIHTPRSDLEKERLWPTKPGPRGNFYFL